MPGRVERFAISLHFLQAELAGKMLVHLVVDHLHTLEHFLEVLGLVLLACLQGAFEVIKGRKQVFQDLLLGSLDLHRGVALHALHVRGHRGGIALHAGVFVLPILHLVVELADCLCIVQALLVGRRKLGLEQRHLRLKRGNLLLRSRFLLDFLGILLLLSGFSLSLRLFRGLLLCARFLSFLPGVLVVVHVDFHTFPSRTKKYCVPPQGYA